jgi:signal peptidase II
MKKYLLGFLKSFIWLFLIVIILDFVTKYFAALYEVSITVIPGFFFLEYGRNTGIAWSLFDDLGDTYWILPTISFLAGSAMFGYFIYNYKKLSLLFRALIMAMAAGTWGNFIDRAFYAEGVIDFLKFDFGSYSFPTFNVADMSLVVSTIGLAVYTLIQDFKNERKQIK